MKIKTLHKGGWLIFLVLMFQLASALPSFAAYAGNIFFLTDVLQGATISGVFTSKPNQDSTGGLLLNTDYTIKDNVEYAGTTYAKMVSISNASTQTVYLLLKNNTAGTYAIKSISLEKTYVPNIVLKKEEVKFYKTGAPANPPTISPIEKGYETAKATWSLFEESNYDYSGMEVQVATDKDFKTLINDGKGNPTTSPSGAVKEYSFGKLVDGRTLNTDADGVTYYFQVKAKVDSDTYATAWSSTSFNTLALGAAGAAQTYTLALETGVPDKFGINFISLPFASPWYAFKPDGKTLNNGAEIKTAYDLVKAINEAAENNKVVSTFGKWDKTATEQKDVGVLILGNDPDNAAKEPGQTKDVKTRLQGIILQQGEGYQLYVNQLPLQFNKKVEIVIKNTAQ